MRYWIQKIKMQIISIAVFLRIILAFFNSFYGPILGADADALKFHETALLVSEDIKNFDFRTGWIFASVLGLIYKISFDSIFLGSLVSIFAWFISAIIFLKMLKIINVSNNLKVIALAIYSFWPSTLFFTSVILREPFQLLFFNLAVYSFLKIVLENKIKYIVLFFTSLIILPMLHKMFVLYSIIFVFLYFIFLISILEKTALRIISITFILLAIIAYFNADSLTNYFYAKVPLNNKSFYMIVSNHINNMTVSRASYQIDEVYIFEFKDFLSYGIKSLYNYFFQPIPKNQEMLGDLILYVENVFRMVLISLILINLFNFTLKNYKLYISLFFLYFTAETAWALGTNNWGTAVRHHIPSLGVMLLLTFYSFKNSKK